MIEFSYRTLLKPGITTAGNSALLVIGIGYIIMSYGLVKGKGWAWTITIETN